MVRGDSGGGLAYIDPQKRWYLQGVVSVGFITTIKNQSRYAFFTDINKFVPWMSSVINEPVVRVRFA